MNSSTFQRVTNSQQTQPCRFTFPIIISLNIFYCQNNNNNGVGSQVLTTLVSTLPLHSIYTQ